MNLDFKEDKEIIITFVEETKEHLTEIEAGILQLENSSENIDDELIHILFRAIHSVKAGANLLKFENIELLSHKLENILQLLRQKRLALNSEIVDTLLKSIDKIEELVTDLKHGDNTNITGLLKKLAKLENQTA